MIFLAKIKMRHFLIFSLFLLFLFNTIFANDGAGGAGGVGDVTGAGGAAGADGAASAAGAGDATGAVGANQKKNYCSSSKYWNCSLSEPEAIPTWVDEATEDLIPSDDDEAGKTEIDDLLLRIAYQTPVSQLFLFLWVFLHF